MKSKIAFVFFFSLCLFDLSNSEGFHIPMKHSILSIPNLTQFQKHKLLLTPSFNQINFTNHNITAASLLSPLAKARSSFFYVELGIGTPPILAKLLFDTGSSTTWTESALCKTCFPVSLPTFDQNRSATYQRMRADHPLCGSVSPTNSSGDKFCSFQIQYLGGERVRGELSFETFIFGDEDSEELKISDLTFGCGIYHDHIDDFSNDTGNPISGVFGIGMQPTSLLKQLSSLTLLRFSYCLPLHMFGDSGHHQHHHTVLSFGYEARISGEVQTTPLVASEYGYYVNLTNLSFNGRLLPIDPSLFVTEGLGVVLDSGTSYTYLREEAYDQLRLAVVEYFLDSYGWIPLEKPNSGMDLCYNPDQGFAFAVFPAIKFHFGGEAEAVLELSKATTFQNFKEVNEMCMMIASSAYYNVFGAFQQVNQRLLFDAAASTLSFAPESC